MRISERKKSLDARGAAAMALKKLRTGSTCQEALSSVLLQTGLSPLEKNLVSELFYGVCRGNSRFEYILKKFLPKPQSLPAVLRDILKIAIYSLLCQDKIPQYAAINCAVEAARKNYGRLGSLANAFLRNVQRNLPDLQSPEWYGKDPFKALAIYCGLPAFIANLWKNAWGEEGAALLMRRSARRPWSGLLPAPHASLSLLDKLEEECSQRLDRGYCFAPGALPENAFALAGKGELHFMAPASWHILTRLGMDKWREPIWDACAGFGGKTLALLFAGANVALASDISSRRLGLLPGQCAKYGARTPEVVLADVADAAVRWVGDILLDVPCSGLGVLARRPDIAMTAAPEKIAALRAIQAKILAGAARTLQTGRRLAYITCTLNPDENENAIRAFLEGKSDFALEAEWQTPHDHPWLEGMYGAVLRKK